MFWPKLKKVKVGVRWKLEEIYTETFYGNNFGNIFCTEVFLWATVFKSEILAFLMLKMFKYQIILIQVHLKQAHYTEKSTQTS